MRNRCTALYLLVEMSVSERIMGDWLINVEEMLAFGAERGVNLREGKKVG